MLIDLRSDTVTKPTKEMLEAMFNAEVGDDVFGEDPTVNALEVKAANLFGMESALYCPSGTQTNQIGIKLHTRPGDEVICESTSHVYRFEGGGISFNSGSSIRLINGDYGKIKASQIEAEINPDDIHTPRTSLVSLENTTNKGGGSCYDFKDIKAIAQVCKSNKLKLHLDGARLFNALVETDESALDYGNIFDSISICLSKGMGAPVGSLLLGDKDFIKEGKRYRKLMGGAMRQAGFLAAAGIYALDNNIDRLREDHKKAKHLETVLEKQNYVKKVFPVSTNICIFELREGITSKDFVERMFEKGIKVIAFGPQLIRLVTHLDFTDEMLDTTIKILKEMRK